MKKYILTFAIIISATLAYAQPNNENAMTIRAVQKVKQLADYITYMADKEKPIEDRKEYRQAALNLFIGQGKSFIVNGAPREGVYMLITSKHRKKPAQRLMKDYFTGLINIRYSKVVIESSEIADIKVSELKKVADHEYECTCTISSAFCGFHDGKPIYKKIPHKRVTCRIFEEGTVKVADSSDIETGYEYVVLLGDVEALEAI